MTLKYLKYFIIFNILSLTVLGFSYHRYIINQSKNFASFIEEQIVTIIKINLDNLIENNFNILDKKILDYHIDGNTIIISDQEKVIRYPIYSLIKNIEKINHTGFKFQLKLNDKLLHSNDKFKIFNDFSKFYLNHKNYLMIKVLPIENYSYINIAYILVTIFIFLSINLLVIQKSFNLLKSDFCIKYKQRLKYYKNHYLKLLKNREDELLTDIWNNKLIKSKDIELNYLFAIHMADINHILYKTNAKNKVVPISYIVTLLKNRFDVEEDIKVFIDYKNGNIEFISEILLCQIIYSLIMNLLFCLRQQKEPISNFIKVNIYANDINLVFQCEWKGRQLDFQKIKLLCKNFFNTHANPHILNFSTILEMLEKLKYSISYKNNYRQIINMIAITKNNFSVNKNNSNIIHLPTFKV